MSCRLRGHATDPPGRWKEPGAFPATDHATQRARQGRGRHRIRRRVDRQCGDGRGPRGSLIRHAGAVRALVIAMIEAPFGAALMALPGGADRRLARRRATRGRAIRMAAITRHADREDAIAASTDLLAKRRIHDVEAARFDWTRRSNHGTRGDDWLGPSEHRGGHRGSGDLTSRPSSRPTVGPQDYYHPSTDFEGALGGTHSRASV